MGADRLQQSKGITKRFHLTEFRIPYAPDQDRQELPNSVVLDFIDGRTLQCACETYMAQAQVLQSKQRRIPTTSVANAYQSCEKPTTPGVLMTRADSPSRLRLFLIHPYRRNGCHFLVANLAFLLSNIPNAFPPP